MPGVGGLRSRIAQEPAALGNGKTLAGLHVLHAHGNPGEGAGILSPRNPCIDVPGLAQGVLGVHPDEGVERRVEPLDRSQGVLDP